MLAPPTLLCWKISYCIHVSTGGKASVRVLLSTWERVPSLLQCYGDGWPAQLLHAPINWQMFPMCVFPLHIAGDPLYSICSELTVQAVMSQNSIFGQWFVPQWRFLERFSTPPRLKRPWATLSCVLWCSQWLLEVMQINWKEWREDTDA